MTPQQSAKVRLERIFRALGDPTRLRILHLLAQMQEVCVCYLVEVIGAPQPKISRHLAYLRRAMIVTARREGKWMHYRLQIPQDRHAGNIVRQTLRSLSEDLEMQRDSERLQRACCGPKSLTQISGAPLPAPAERVFS